jgi:hypothetical protein
MKQTLVYLFAIVALTAAVGCATMDRDHTSLQDWRRSYLPTRNG